MKVVLLSALYPPEGRGGAEKAASLLAESLAERGIEVVVITTSSSPQEEVVALNGVRVYRLPLDNFSRAFRGYAGFRIIHRALWHLRDVWNIRAARRVAAILDQERPDVVHSHVIAGFSIAVWRESRRRQIKLVHTLHDYYLLCYRSSLFKEKQCLKRCLPCKMARLPHKRWANRLDYVIPVSTPVLQIHTAEGYLNGVPSSVLHNICPPPLQGNASCQRSAVKSVMVFGFIGKVEKPKGIEVLLEAVKLLDGHGWRLILAGDGDPDYLHRLKESYPHPNISWKGFVSPASFYEEVDVVVIPSLWSEPAAYTVVESVLAGKGILCSDKGGSAEIAALGDAYAVYPSEDAAQLASLMRGIVESPSRWLNLRPREEVQSSFEAGEVAARHLAIYRALREERPIPGS